MQVMEIVVESDQQTLRQVDVFGRDDKAQREGTQYEDQHRNQRPDEDSLGVVLARIFHVHHMDTHHLHTGVEQEDTRSQHQVVEFGQVGEESLAHVHVIMSAGTEVDDPEDDQQAGRDNRPDHTADFRNLADPRQPFQGDGRGGPVDDQYDDQCENFVRRQHHVVMRVHADKGDRDGSEGQHGRIPDRTFDPLQPDGQETRAGAHRFADPAEHTALFVGEHRRQLGCDQRGRDQENDRREQVIKC